MTITLFAEGQVLFREGDPADTVFRILSGTVAILRELDGEPILLGTVGAGQFIGEMGVVENRPRSATVRAANDVEVEIFTPTAFFDQIASSPPAARELIRRLVSGYARPTIASSTTNGEKADGMLSRQRRAAKRFSCFRITPISPPRTQGCSVSCTLQSNSGICRSSSAECRLQKKSGRSWRQTSNSMTPRRSGCRATTS